MRGRDQPNIRNCHPRPRTHLSHWESGTCSTHDHRTTHPFPSPPTSPRRAKARRASARLGLSGRPGRCWWAGGGTSASREKRHPGLMAQSCSAGAVRPPTPTSKPRCGTWPQRGRSVSSGSQTSSTLDLAWVPAFAGMTVRAGHCDRHGKESEAKAGRRIGDSECVNAMKKVISPSSKLKTNATTRKSRGVASLEHLRRPNPRQMRLAVGTLIEHCD